MILTEPSKFKTSNWLNVKKELINSFGVKESSAISIVFKFRTTIERGRKYCIDCTLITERILGYIKSASAKRENGEREFASMFDAEWRPPCSKCGGAKEYNIDDYTSLPCDHCTDGREPEDIFSE